MSFVLAAETSQEGGGVNLVVVALVLVVVALAAYLWRRRAR